MPSRHVSFAVIVCITLLPGCTASKKSRVQAQATPADLSQLRAIHAQPGQSTIVLYKKSAFGSMFGPIRIQSNVFVDQVPTGDLSDYQYAVIGVSPGRHSLRTFAAIQGTNLSATKLVTTQPDQVVFLELESKQGWNSASVTLEERGAGDDLVYEEIAAHCKLGFESDLAVR